MMSTSNLSWQQIAVFALCLAATFAAHIYLGLDAGMAGGLITSLIAFFMGRPMPSAPAPAKLEVLQGGKPDDAA